jgi:hypothetical protein
MSQENNKEDSSTVDHYLESPKKKRKLYLVFAVGPKFDLDLKNAIEKSFKEATPGLSISQPKKLEDLIKFTSRDVKLLIADDSFSDQEELLEVIKKVKLQKGAEPLPVVFLTEQAEDLIKIYNKKLRVYQEVDNYINFKSLSIQQIISRLQKLSHTKERRRSKRFNVDIEISYSNLTSSKNGSGRLTNLSLHGGVLQSTANEIFKAGDQIKVSIPTSKFFTSESGDFLKLACKVRRVFMGGDRSAVSWEYMSENRQEGLAKFLLHYVDFYMSKS